MNDMHGGTSAWQRDGIVDAFDMHSSTGYAGAQMQADVGRVITRMQSSTAHWPNCLQIWM